MGWAVRGSNSGNGKRVYFLQIRPGRLWGPPSLLFNGYRVPLLGIKRLGREAQVSPLSSDGMKNYCMIAPSLLFRGYGAAFPGREADCSPPSNAEVKSAWCYTFATPKCLHGVDCYFFFWLCSPARAMSPSFTRFLDHTQRRVTVGRTPLDE
jgi:hypothetical protein